MKFHQKQQDFIDNITYEVKNSHEKKRPVFMSVVSSPGSGKTTIILKSAEELSHHLSQNIEYSYANIPKKQVLILVFDKKMKTEIQKKIEKNENINEDLFEITTVHSLFFRELKKFQKTEDKNSGFELDFTKSFFTKKMIAFFLGTLSVSSQKISDNIDKKIENRRIFQDNSLLTENNIDILWALTNTFYSSPHTLTMTKEIGQDASFFLKDGRSFNDLIIPPGAEKTLDGISKIYGKEISNEELLFRILIQRIQELAVVKEKIEHRQVVRTEIPIEIFDAKGNIVETQSKTVEKVHLEYEILGNIVKVPHCYYYKSFFNKLSKDKEFANAVFGDYKAILVDEAQDNDRILFQTIVAIATQGIVKNFAFVGDPLQSIYAFKSPDHFDMLSFMDRNSKGLEKMGIVYKKHMLDITYRFGKEISSFVNSLFQSSINSMSGNKNFVFPEQIEKQKMHTLVKNLSRATDKTTAIICRSNAEVMRIFVELKKSGVENLLIHSSAKDELKEFFKHGTSVFTNEFVKKKIGGILEERFGKKENYTFDEVVSSQEAVDLLANNGHANLVKFSSDEIQNYIISGTSKRKNVVWVGTSHLFKGAEFDFVVVASDFFQKQERIMARDIILSSDKQENQAEHDFLYGLLNPSDDSKTLAVSPQEPDDADFGSAPANTLREQLLNPKNNEEKCIYYVALTRAKEGLFFSETPYWSEIKQHIHNSFDVKKEHGFLLEEPVVEIKEKEKKATDFSLFAEVEMDDEIESAQHLFH